eukprot:m.204710 g.204710  ORF g.204710 m.204710 type:complete len:1172 (-) comp16886_c2_seq11:276-3791(-)
MDNSDQFIRLKKAKQVHELLQEYGIDSLNELMTLSRREVEYQFQDEDPVTLQRLCDAINYAKSQPEWLHREWHHVWTSTFIGGAVLCAWLVGYFNLSLLWAILLAGIVIEGTRRLKDNYYQQVTMSARRQASKMRATHFGESAEWFNQVLQDCWSLGARTYFQDIIKESVNDVFDYYKPPGMQSLAISDLELGSQGLVITHIHNFPAENETDRTVDVWLTYSSQDAKLVFKAKVAGISAAFTISKVEMHAHCRFYIHLNKDLPMPFVQSVEMTMLSSPTVDFGLVPLGTFDLMKVFPVLDRWVKGVLVACLDELFLEPERFEIYSGEPNAAYTEETNGLLSGILLVDVLSGKDLQPTSKKKRGALPLFSVAVSTFTQRFETPPAAGPNPTWDHQYGVGVFHSSADKVVVEVFDRRLGLKPTVIGRARFRMSELVTDAVAEGKTLAFNVDLYDKVGSVDIRFKYVKLLRLPSRFLPPDVAHTLLKQRDESSTELVHTSSKAAGATSKMPDTTDSEASKLAENVSPQAASIPDATDDLARLATLADQALVSHTGVLFIRIHKAANLHSGDRATKLSDPFCVAKFNGCKVLCSPVIFKTLNPNWDTKLSRSKKHSIFREFLVQDIRKATIDLRVYDYDSFSLNDFLGACSINLADMTSQPKFVVLDEWFHLSSDKSPKACGLASPSHDEGRGKICISLIFRPVTVNPDTFDAESCLGGATVSKKVNRKSEGYRKKNATQRQDPDGGPVRGPEYYPKGGLLKVQVCEGRGLVPKDKRMFGAATSDPYVIARLGQHDIYKTKVVNRSLKPIWTGESFTATVMDVAEEPFSLSVFDYDLLSRDDFMGSVIIPLTTDLDGTARWFQLGPENNGELKLMIRFIPTSQLASEGHRPESPLRRISSLPGGISSAKTPSSRTSVTTTGVVEEVLPAQNRLELDEEDMELFTYRSADRTNTPIDFEEEDANESKDSAFSPTRDSLQDSSSESAASSSRPARNSRRRLPKLDLRLNRLKRPTNDGVVPIQIVEFDDRRRSCLEPMLDLRVELQTVTNLAGTHATFKLSVWKEDTLVPLQKGTEICLDQGRAFWKDVICQLSNAQLKDSLHLDIYTRTSRLKKTLAASATFTVEELMSSNLDNLMSQGTPIIVTRPLHGHRAAYDGNQDITASFKVQIMAVKDSV